MKLKITFSILFLLISTILFSTEALFYVSTVTGDTIFAVYPDGIKVKNEDGNKVFSATGDSIRFYLNETVGAGRGSRGGFAIGGVGSANREGNTDFLTVTADSTRILVKEPSSGFKIASAMNDSTPDFLRLT
ncbi:MAG: hypothetical protein K8S23_03430 [Candidatus Cloacimonetes bacterium]|nr:hypothetical protein [Candidatus Cloacimonadota bacterium]